MADILDSLANAGRYLLGYPAASSADHDSGLTLADLVAGKKAKGPVTPRPVTVYDKNGNAHQYMPAESMSAAQDPGFLDRVGHAFTDVTQHHSPAAMLTRYLSSYLPSTSDYIGGGDNSQAAQQARARARVIQTERNYREQQAGAEADHPTNTLKKKAAGFIGAAAGGLVADPTSLIAPGRTLAQRVLSQGAVSGGEDAAQQGLEMVEGTRDDFDPSEVAWSAGTGAVLPVVHHAIKAVIPQSIKDRFAAKAPEAVSELDDLKNEVQDPVSQRAQHILNNTPGVDGDLVNPAAPPVTRMDPVPVPPKFDPEVAAQQRERLSNLGAPPEDPRMSTAEGEPTNLTFPKTGAVKDINAYNDDGLRAKLAEAGIDPNEIAPISLPSEAPVVSPKVEGNLPSRGVAPAVKGEDGTIYVGEIGDNHISAAKVAREIDPNVNLVHTGGFVDSTGKFMGREEALSHVNSNGENIKPNANMPGELDALDYRDQSHNVPPDPSSLKREKWEKDNPWWTGKRYYQTPSDRIASNPPSEPARPPDEVPSEVPEQKIESTSDVVNRLTGAIKDAQELLPAQRELYRQERSSRLKAVMAARASSEGQAGLHAELSALKGEMPKQPFEHLRDEFSQEDIDGLMEHIKNAPGLGPYGPIRGRVGLAKILAGNLPTKSELDILSKVFPTEFIKSIIANRRNFAKAFGTGEQKELFSGAETISGSPIRVLKPEPKPVDPDKFVVHKGQGDLFTPKSQTKEPNWRGSSDQQEMFSGAETLSKGPPTGPLKPEPKPVDPDKFVVHKGQGDLFITDDAPKPRPPSLPKEGPLRSAVSNALNIPRSLMSSFDLSAPFRQGLFMAGRKEFWGAFKDMFKAFGSERAFKALSDEIDSRPTRHLMDEAGLYLADPNHSLGDREEQFMSSWAEKIPLIGRGVRASDRAYTGFLNKVRADVFDSILRNAEGAGIDIPNDPKALKDLGSFINNATGRGNLGKTLSTAGPMLNAMFFSPRLIASRVSLLNPAYYASLSPVVRKEAVRSLLHVGALATTVTGLAAALGLDVESDPRSSDFAKIKTGNTSYDILGGFGQYITFGARLLSNETKTNGQVSTLGQGYGKPNRLNVIERFGESKLSPIAGLVADYYRGKTYTGEPLSVQNEAIKNLIPLFLQDAKAVMAENGVAKGAAMSVPGLFGVGMNTYSPIPPAPNSIKVDHHDVQLNDDARDQYQKMVKFYLDENIKVLKTSGDWDKYTLDERNKLTAKIVQDGRKQAKKDLFEAAPPAEDAPSPTPTVSEDKPLFDGFEGLPTSVRRTVAGNERVGGVAHSDHLSGDAVDFKPPKGMTMSQLEAAAVKYFGPNNRILNEGDHIHVHIPGLHGPLYGHQGAH